jgi:hypothetical protein
LPDESKLGASLFAVPHPHNKRAGRITAAVLMGLIKLEMVMIFPLAVTDYTFLIIGSAVTFVATAGVHLAVDLVQCQIIPTMNQLAVRPVAELDGRLDLKFVGMAVVAERAFVTGGAELCIAGCIQAMGFNEVLGMVERCIRLHGPPDLIFVTFSAYWPAFSEFFHVPGREGCFGGKQAACGYCEGCSSKHEKYADLGPSHFFAPLLIYA